MIRVIIDVFLPEEGLSLVDVDLFPRVIDLFLPEEGQFLVDVDLFPVVVDVFLPKEDLFLPDINLRPAKTGQLLAGKGLHFKNKDHKTFGALPLAV